MITDPTPYAATLHNISQQADALLIIMDSGGGSGGACEAVARELRSVGTTIPVVVYVKNICASGAYLIASASHMIIAPQLSHVGSIGALIGVDKESINSFQRKEKSEDEHEEIVVSGNVSHEIISSSDHKIATHPLSGELSEEEREAIQQETITLSRYFADHVAHARDIEDTRDLWATGDMFNGQYARELGLIDHIGSYTDALNTIYRMLKRADPDATITSLSLKPWHLQKFS